MQQAIQDRLGMASVEHYEIYLGLPSFVGRNKKASFDNIEQRVWKKLQGWEGKLLSQAGREILIKAVAQALPTYTMSCFKLPIGLCHDMEALIRIFFWGQRGENRKIHWLKWQELCKPKSQGGLGFKDLSQFNDALLAKQTWRLLHDTGSLFYRIFKAKYFPSRSIMEAKNPSSASYAWKSIIKGLEVIKRGTVWRIGDGTSIRIWQDRWLPDRQIGKIISPCWPEVSEATVSMFINPATCSWKSKLLEKYLLEFKIAAIRSIPLCRTQQQDKLIWPLNPNGAHSVKSGYKFLQSESQN